VGRTKKKTVNVNVWLRSRHENSKKGLKLSNEVSLAYQVNVLEQSGILDAYEYFLRAICKNGLP
jgi:hypothetical protein